MSEIGVTLLTSAATIAGGSIAIVAATFSQDRARLHRERMLASALLVEVRRIRARMPKIEPSPTVDVLALPPATELHTWVEHGTIELAAADQDLFARLIDLQPTIAVRNTLLQSYQYTMKQIEEAEQAEADLSDAIESPGAVWQTRFSYTNVDAARKRLLERKARTTSLRVEVVRMEGIASTANCHVTDLLFEVEQRLATIATRPIPRFPGPTISDAIRWCRNRIVIRSND